MSSDPGQHVHGRPRRVGLLVNPAAGAGTAGRCGERIADDLRAHGDDVLELHARTAEQARELGGAAVTDGLDVLVVAGGDGMVGLGVELCALTDTAVAIAAVGSGNDFARSMRLPVHAPRATARMIAAGHTRTIDLGHLVDDSPAPAHGGFGGDRWFAGVLAAGFDALVNRRANGFGPRLGRLGYPLAVARELPGFRPISYRIEVDDQVVETEAMLVAVGNGTSYGGGMRICAGAEPDDGLLDVLVLHQISRTGLLRVFPRVFTGSHLSHPAVQVLRGSRVRVQAEGVLTYADGEPFAPVPLTCEAVPGALRLVTPRP